MFSSFGPFLSLSLPPPFHSLCFFVSFKSLFVLILLRPCLAFFFTLRSWSMLVLDSGYLLSFNRWEEVQGKGNWKWEKLVLFSGGYFNLPRTQP
ncbi:hypothetical protein VTN00DRAFT_391 [Thermoascus crustaceus]|uniref:uncharacterized protein n=1 Tax=Thermoascus crustaceus TaxID=5088 RepID=UPI00374309BE